MKEDESSQKNNQRPIWMIIRRLEVFCSLRRPSSIICREKLNSNLKWKVRDRGIKKWIFKSKFCDKYRYLFKEFYPCKEESRKELYNQKFILCLSWKTHKKCVERDRIPEVTTNNPIPSVKGFIFPSFVLPDPSPATRLSFLISYQFDQDIRAQKLT